MNLKHFDRVMKLIAYCPLKCQSNWQQHISSMFRTQNGICLRINSHHNLMFHRNSAWLHKNFILRPGPTKICFGQSHCSLFVTRVYKVYYGRRIQHLRKQEYPVSWIGMALYAFLDLFSFYSQ